jgi:serine kinase of HPr protein (carbohydrate metabolism regulator)
MSAVCENLHASAVQLAGQGVIIFGPSGSGKSSLALELLRQVLRDGKEALLVSDDRVDVSKRQDHLAASPPAPLAGLIEVRGSGIHPIISHAPSARLHLAVELVEESLAQRIAPAGPRAVALGIALPCLMLPRNQTEASVRAILSHLGLCFPVLRKKNSA